PPLTRERSARTANSDDPALEADGDDQIEAGVLVHASIDEVEEGHRADREAFGREDVHAPERPADEPGLRVAIVGHEELEAGLRADERADGAVAEEVLEEGKQREGADGDVAAERRIVRGGAET